MLSLELTHDQDSTPRYNQKKTCINMKHGTQCSQPQYTQWPKQSKCPLTDELINKRWYIHVIEYYLAIKKNEVLIHATAQIKP